MDRPTEAYAVHLLFDAPVQLDGDGIWSRFHALFPEAERLGDLQFVHAKAVSLEGHVTIPQAVVTPAASPPDPEELHAAIQQTWNWEGARAAVGKARFAVVATDMMAGGLPPMERLRLFFGLVRVVLEPHAPLAIHWRASQRLVDPQAFLEAGSDDERFAHAAVNVRMFKVADAVAEGETVMDTRGLDVLGLPDVECHFAGLRPDRVAIRLASTAHYLWQHGDVCRDGDTIDGLDGEKWSCQHGRARSGPDRPVLVVTPGRHAVALSPLPEPRASVPLHYGRAFAMFGVASLALVGLWLSHLAWRWPAMILVGLIWIGMVKALIAAKK